MQVIINRSNSVKTGPEFVERSRQEIENHMDIYADRLTRIEAHFSDSNGSKGGDNDIQCTLEARVAGIKRPFAVTCQSENLSLALQGALDKLTASLESQLGKLSDKPKFDKQQLAFDTFEASTES